MSDETIVTGPTLAMTGVLIAASIAAALVWPAERPDSRQTVEERRLVVVERPDGGVDVTDGRGRIIDRLVIEGDLFAITAMRSVVGRVGPERPGERFAVLVRRDSRDRLAVADPRTGRSLALDGFGPDNQAALAAYLPPAR